MKDVRVQRRATQKKRKDGLDATGCLETAVQQICITSLVNNCGGWWKKHQQKQLQQIRSLSGFFNVTSFVVPISSALLLLLSVKLSNLIFLVVLPLERIFLNLLNYETAQRDFDERNPFQFKCANAE